jgi:hypothetical protein
LTGAPEGGFRPLFRRMTHCKLVKRGAQSPHPELKMQAWRARLAVDAQLEPVGLAVPPPVDRSLIVVHQQA